MKIRKCLLLMVIAAFACCGIIYAQADISVKAVKSGTKKNLLGVTFIDEKTGFCVGQDGTLLKTADGGATWKKVKIDTDAELCDISFYEKKVGWIVGTGGTSEKLPKKLLDYWCGKGKLDMEILQYINMAHFLCGANVPTHPTVLATTDGGATWSKKKVLKTNFIPTAVCAVDKETAWFSTYTKDHGDGDLWVTRNGGCSWRMSRMWRNIYDFQMIDAKNGWAVGEPESYNGRRERACSVLRISSGGRYEKLDEDFASKEAVMAVHFISKKQGWMVTEQGSIYHTDDAGKTFKRQFGPEPPDTTRRERKLGHVYDKKVKFPYEVIRFGDATHGLAAGRGGMLYTTDGGKKWEKAKLPLKAHIRDIAFITPTTAFGVADKGVILKIKLP